MSMIQIRNVPPELHRTLKVRAAQAGMSLSEYLLRDLESIAARPRREDVLERLSQLPPLELGDLPARTIREMRDAG